MEDFARATGLEGDAPTRRYLWTDAFAVCNYLGLEAATGEARYRRLALELVDEVHFVLGRHRPDDPRSGWISRLDESEGHHHPTIGGLRIGKPRTERSSRDPHDARSEWDRDGQYYHYLTKWMHALLRVSQETGEASYHRWAAELADFAHRAFRTPDGTRLYWKVSIDGSRPAVPSSGLHDPLDGLLTLASLIEERPDTAPSPAASLAPALRELSAMCRTRTWRTEDPLGAGFLLLDVCRGSRIAGRLGAVEKVLPRVVRDAIDSLRLAVAHGAWEQPASRRMAFREIGLAIGIRSADRLTRAERAREHLALLPNLAASLETALASHRPVADAIEQFWMDPTHRLGESWRAHRDISAVMLATCLSPDGFLGGT
jgi:hypothetical protein